jgi:hypothetical protein
MEDSIKKALAEARGKLSKFVNEREKLDKQIQEWKRVVDSLKAVSEEASENLPGEIEIITGTEFLAPYQGTTGKPDRRTRHRVRLNFTDAIREILRLDEPEVVRVPAIRDYLAAWGFDFSKYKQELVPIHNTLKRLEEQGEATAVKNTNGRIIGYQWITPIERAIEGEPESAKAFARSVAKALMFGQNKLREQIKDAAPTAASQKGQVKTDDAASTKTN